MYKLPLADEQYERFLGASSKSARGFAPADCGASLVKCLQVRGALNESRPDGPGAEFLSPANPFAQRREFFPTNTRRGLKQFTARAVIYGFPRGHIALGQVSARTNTWHGRGD